MSRAGARRVGRGEKVRRALCAAVVVSLWAGVFTAAAVPASAGPGPTIDSSPSGASTATSLEWTFSNASPASCELTEGATTISALADCSSPADFDVSSDAGGSYTFTVYAAAAADVVVGTTPAATSTVDVAPVAPTITASPPSPHNDPTPTWIFTLPKNASATCELDDPTDVAVQTVATCTSPFTAASLNAAPANGANGAYTLSVTPTAGGVTGAAATSSYTFDTVQPPAPAVDANAVTGFSLHPTFAVSGLVAGATLNCSVSSPAGGPAVTVSTCGSTTTLDLTGGIDGSYLLHVTQTHAGNVSADGTASYLLDTHTPATPNVTAPTSPGADASPTFAISGIESGAVPVCTVTGPSSVPAPACGAATTLNLSSASQGTYTLTVRAVDAAGKSSASATATYTFEATGPATPVVTGPSSPGNSRVPSFVVTDSDPVDLTYDCTVTGPSSVTTSQCGPTTGVDLSGAADGTYHLSVVAIDGLGQTSPAGKAAYTLDTTPPPAPTVTAPVSPSSDTTPSFVIDESESGTTLTCTVDGPTSFPVPPGDCASGLILDLNGANRDGVYTLSVTATDAAGNVGPVGSATYTLDTTPPPAPSIVAPPSPSKDLTPTFTITDAESTVSFSCLLMDPINAVVFNGACPANGTFDTSSDSTDGPYTLIVTATDEAGNQSQSTSMWTRDTTPPPVPTVGAPLSPSRDLTPTFSISDSQSGVTFSCVLTGPGGVNRFTGTCPANGIFDLGGFGDGVYSLAVKGTDAAGNTSAPRTVSYTLDTTAPPAPTVVLSAPLLSLSNVTQPQFTVSDSESGVSYDCSVSGATTVPASAINCGATTTVDLSGAGRDGDYTLSVTATDAAGNTSPAGTATYTLDTTLPPNPSVVAPPSPSNDITPTFTINDSESDVVLDCVLHAPGNTTAFANLCPASGTFDLTGFGDGTYVLSVTATDPAGNSAAPPSTATYVLDTTAPTAPSVALSVPASSPGSVTGPQFAVTGVETGATLACSVTGPTPVPSSAIVCGPTTTVDLSGTGRDGTYTVSVTATDAAGNTSVAGRSSYLLDTTPPSPPTVALSVPATSPGNVTAPQFSVTGVEAGATLACSVTGPTTVPNSAITCGPTTTVDLSGTGRDGSYTLSVTATDAAGNTSTAAAAAYVLDTTPPPAPVVTPPPGASTKMPTFGLSDGDPTAVLTCVLTSPKGKTVFALATCPATGTFDTTAFADGIYTLVVTATDPAGNSTSTTATWTRDTTPPPVPVLVLSAGLSSPSNNPTPSFTVSDTEAGVILTCSASKGATIVPGSAISCGAMTTVDLVGTGGDGTYTVSVTATDAAGNTSAAGTATYTWDTTPPPVPTVTLTVPATSPGNVTAPQFTVSDPEAGVAYTCAVTFGPASTPVAGVVTTCGTGTTLNLVGADGDGLYTVSVTATDVAGNTSPAGSATYTLDTTAPPAPVVIPPAGASTKMPTFGISDGDPTAVLTCVLTSPKGKTVFALATCPASGTFDTTGFIDGTYTLVVTATDPAGNATSTTVTWLRDTTPPPNPTVTLTVPASSPSNVTTPQFSVPDTDGTPPTPVTYSCSVTFGATAVPGVVTACGTTTTLNLSSANGDGLYTLSVTETDAAGNTSAAGTATYTLDTTPPPMPTATLTVPASSPGNVTAPQFTVTGVESGATLTCSVTGPTTVPASAVGCGATTTVDLSGAGRDGTYQLAVTATDVAGNTSAAGTATYLLDTTAPVAPVVTLTTPASSPGNVTTPQFSVTDTEPGVTFSCTMTGQTTVPASAINCGATTTVNLAGAGRDGSYVLSVTATDAAGNTSPADTATYILDTTPPGTPLASLNTSTPSSSKNPLWTWQYAFNDVNTGQDTAICTVTGPRGWTTTKSGCPQQFAPTLAGGDGIYTLVVTLTDEAGNVSHPSAPVSYKLDSTSPPGATVSLLPRFHGGGLSRHPVWSVTGPPRTTLMCSLHSGDGDGPVVSAPAVCSKLTTYSLVGEPDGLYTIEVIAIDAAGNDSSPAHSTYVLAPSAPQVQAPQSQNPRAVWTVDGNPSNPYECTLFHDGRVVSAARTCSSRPTYDMTSMPAGTYQLSVVQTGAEGFRSQPGSATWVWGGIAPPPPPGSGGHPGTTKHPTTTKAPTHPGGLSSIPGAIRKQIERGVKGLIQAPFFHPHLPQDKVTREVVKAVQGVVHAVGAAGGGTGFPLLLIALVLIFLIVQNRIDRRDPKLALASIAADDTVEFQPPPSRRDRP
jgi:large repetitive protein